MKLEFCVGLADRHSSYSHLYVIARSEEEARRIVEQHLAGRKPLGFQFYGDYKRRFVRVHHPINRHEVVVHEQQDSLSDVSLGNGLFQEKRDRIKNFLRLYDERRFLVLFNNMAGRPNPPGVTATSERKRSRLDAPSVVPRAMESPVTQRI